MHSSPLRLVRGCQSTRHQQVAPMSVSATHAQALPPTNSFAEIESHWETEILKVWNAKLFIAEECELVYEVSWIPELGFWRRFLRFQRKLQA
jgi:hypothetical protein